METIKLIPHENGLTIKTFQSEDENLTHTLSSIRFELDTLCDVPILIFTFRAITHPLVIPLNFSTISFWPQQHALIIELQLMDLFSGELFSKRVVTITAEQTKKIWDLRRKQHKMDAAQIDMIVDFIDSDYIEFAGLTKVS